MRMFMRIFATKTATEAPVLNNTLQCYKRHTFDIHFQNINSLLTKSDLKWCIRLSRSLYNPSIL